MLKKVVLRGYMCIVISCPSLAENGHVNNENWCESKAQVLSYHQLISQSDNLKRQN